MHTQKANSQNAFDLVQSQNFIANVATILTPAFREMVSDGVIGASCWRLCSDLMH